MPTMTYLATEVGDFSIVAELNNNGVEFTCYRCAALSVPNGTPHYLERDWDTSCDLTYDLEEAEWFMQATVRLDGRTSIYLNQDKGVLDDAGSEDFVDRLAKLIKRLPALMTEYVLYVLDLPIYKGPHEVPPV